MIASEDEEVLRILDLVCKEQADSLQTLLSTINVVAEEQVIGSRREAAILEEAKEVVVLTVDIAWRDGSAQRAGSRRRSYRKS